jgi:hypothetical protein
MCPYYFIFAFRSVNVGVNITIQDNYTLEITVLGNSYQPAQLVYSVTEPSQGVISPTYAIWGVCITLSPDNTVSVLFPCLTYDGLAIFFFAHNVNIPFSESNSPRLPLTVVPGYNVSDVNLLTFTPAWSLSALCAWFSMSGIPQPLQWTLGDVQISMFSFHYNLNDNANTCNTPDGLRFISTLCNSTALTITIASQQIIVSYQV